MNHDVNAQRVGFFTLLPSLLRKLGTDPRQVNKAAGLEADALDHPEKFIPYDAAARLLSISAVQSGCPHLGLLLGQNINTTRLGLVGELMRSAPTLGDALRGFAAQQHHNARGGLVYFLRQEKKAFLGYAVYDSKIEGNSHICDAAAMAAYTIVRELAPSIASDEMVVKISRITPPDVTPYEQLFDVKVEFDASQTAVMIPTACLRLPLAGANAASHHALQQRFKALSKANEMTVATQLRREVRIGLLTGAIHGDQLAAKLELNRRTLHRHLAEEGVTFQQILDEARCEFAQQLMTYTRLSLAEITPIVQYVMPSVFTRAFIRWTGVTPSEWREGKR